MMALCAGVIGFYLPNVFIENLAQKRQQSIRQAFPDSLDMLLICVQSGMSVESAFGKVAKEITQQSLELGEELALTTAELSYLGERRLAFENLGKRTGIPGVKAVATALIQAERYGTPVSQALRVMAKENRDIRMGEAEKKAAALPPKLTVPMIIFFLPVLFLVILGPAAIRYLRLHLSGPAHAAPSGSHPSWSCVNPVFAQTKAGFFCPYAAASRGLTARPPTSTCTQICTELNTTLTMTGPR